MPHLRAIPRALVDRKIGSIDKSYYLYDIDKTISYKESTHDKEKGSGNILLLPDNQKLYDSHSYFNT